VHRQHDKRDEMNMKSSTIFLSVLLVLSFKLTAQIPNSGFEDWTNFGNYEDPTFWGSTNFSSSGPFYAVTKSDDHWPLSVGSYSVRIENNTSLNPDYSARGYLATGTPPPGPDFVITGHPSSLTGYYKFSPQNGDTMLIQIQLYKNGLSVAYGEFSSAAPTSGWSGFNIPVSSYSEADSASIFISAYYADDFNAIPHGNSVLYVDNLNFDNLITSVSETTFTEKACSIHPIPASDFIFLDVDIGMDCEYMINIYHVNGNLVKSETIKQNQRKIDIRSIDPGVYFVEMKSGERRVKQRLIIQR